MQPLLLLFIATIISISSNVYAIPPPVEFAIYDTTTINLDAPPPDECFYDVTVPELLAIGYVKYAWVPWSVLSAAALQIAPNGAFVYKTTEDTLVYEKMEVVPIDSPNITLKFGPSLPFCPEAKTFEDITSGAVKCSDDDTINERINTGLNCWSSPLKNVSVTFVSQPTEDTSNPSELWSQFAWVSMDALKCGEFVYQNTDGSGLIQHSCDSPETNAQDPEEVEEGGDMNEEGGGEREDPCPMSVVNLKKCAESSNAVGCNGWWEKWGTQDAWNEVYINVTNCEEASSALCESGAFVGCCEEELGISIQCSNKMRGFGDCPLMTDTSCASDGGGDVEEEVNAPEEEKETTNDADPSSAYHLIQSKMIGVGAIYVWLTYLAM